MKRIEGMQQPVVSKQGVQFAERVGEKSFPWSVGSLIADALWATKTQHKRKSLNLSLKLTDLKEDVYECEDEELAMITAALKEANFAAGVEMQILDVLDAAKPTESKKEKVNEDE